MAEIPFKHVIFTNRTNEAWDCDHIKIPNKDITCKVDIHGKHTSEHGWAASTTFYFYSSG